MLGRSAYADKVCTCESLKIWAATYSSSKESRSSCRYKTENGLELELIEEVTIEVNEEHVGLVMEALSHRRAEIVDMGPVPRSVGRTRLSLTCPSRVLVGYRSVFGSDTHGTVFMHRAFLKLILIYSRWEEKNKHKNRKRKP